MNKINEELNLDESDDESDNVSLMNLMKIKITFQMAF